MSFTIGSIRRTSPSWFGKLARGARRSRVPKRRASLRPDVESVEDRLAPAVVGVLSISGTTLTYSGFVQNTNNVTISGTAAALTFADAGGTIQNNTGGQFVNGGALPGYITGVAVNGNDLTDVANVPGAGLDLGTRALTLSSNFINVAGNISARAVTFNATQTNVTAATTIATNAAVNPAAGAVTFTTHLNLGAALTINTDSVTDGNVTFNRLVTGVDVLTVNAGFGGNVTAQNLISLGGIGALLIQSVGVGVGANNITLRQVVAEAGITLVAANSVTFAGTVSSSGPITIGANQDGVGNQGFTQTAGDINTSLTSAFPAVQLVVNGIAGGGGTGTGNAQIRNIIVGAGSAVFVVTGPFLGGSLGGGAILDGNGPGQLNVTASATGLLLAFAGAGGINLDTQVAAGLFVTGNGLSGNVPIGSINVRNTQFPLTASAFTSNGSISISNNNDIAIAPVFFGAGVIANGTNADVTITTTSSAPNKNISIANGTVLSVDALGDTVTLNATGTINDTAATPAAINSRVLKMTAGDGVGTTSTLNVDVDTMNARTNIGGINVTDTDDLIVTGATASAGSILLTTANVANADLTLNGPVSTAAGGAITLTYGEDLFMNFGGRIQSDTGAVTFTPSVTGGASHIAAFAAGSAVTTGGGVTFTGTAENGSILLSGAINAGGAVSIEAAATSANLLVAVDGSLAAGGLVTIGSAGVTGTSTISIGGSLTAGGGLTILGGALASTVVNTAGTSTITASGAVAITGGTTGNTVINLAGTLANLASTTTITGSTGGGVSTINLAGSLSSVGAVSLTYAGAGIANIVVSGGVNSAAGVSVGNAAATGALYATLSGSITGASFTVNGSTVADTINLIGTITGPSTFNGNAGDDLFYLKPQTGSAFTIDGGAGTSDTVQILTSLLNIVTANLTTATFTVPSGFQSWTLVPGTVETIIPFV